MTQLPSPPAPRPAKLDAYLASIQELLRKYPEITAQRVFEDPRVEGYDGGYTAVRERVAGLRPRAIRVVSVRSTAS